MFKINGEDWELPVMGKTPTIGYEYTYTSKTTLDGKIHRKYVGRRFNATFSYAILTDAQVAKIKSWAESNDGVSVEISTPIDIFTGKAYLTILNAPQRFKPDTWTAWQLQLTGAEVVT